MLHPGASATVEDDVDDPNQGLVANVAGIPSALMYGAMIDQDTNCRLVGRCVHGALIDRELRDMIPRDSNDNLIPLTQGQGRRFLYARYNADLSRAGLDALGFSDIKPKNVQKLDSVEFISDLRDIGKKIGEEMAIEHFGTFV